MHRKTTMTLLVLGGLIVSILVVLFGLIVPTMKDVRTIERELIAEQRILEERYRQGLLLKRLRDDWEIVRPEMSTLESALLTYTKSVPFITQLESIATKTGITHRLTLPLPHDQDKRAETPIPFTFDWQGDWIALLTTLVTIEREPYALPIEHIRIVSEGFSSPPSPVNPFAQLSPLPPLPESKSTGNITMQLMGTTIWKNE